MPSFLARLFARFRRPVDTRVYALSDPEQDGPAWSSIEPAVPGVRSWRCWGHLDSKALAPPLMFGWWTRGTMPPLVATLPGCPGWSIPCQIVAFVRIRLGDAQGFQVELRGTGEPVGTFPAVTPRELKIRAALGGRPLTVVLDPQMEFSA